MFRELEKQLETKDVERLKTVQFALEECRVAGRVSSYYIFEICRAIESGMLLASLELATTLIELWLRDLLVIRRLTQTKIENTGGMLYQLGILDTKVEGIERGISYRDMVLELQVLEVIDQSEREWLMQTFNKIRNPIHHGLSGKLIGNHEKEDLRNLDEMAKKERIMACIFSINSPHDRLNRFEDYLDRETITVLEETVNFLGAHPIPKLNR